MAPAAAGVRLLQRQGGPPAKCAEGPGSETLLLTSVDLSIKWTEGKWIRANCGADQYRTDQVT